MKKIAILKEYDCDNDSWSYWLEEQPVENLNNRQELIYVSSEEELIPYLSEIDMFDLETVDHLLSQQVDFTKLPEEKEISLSNKVQNFKEVVLYPAIQPHSQNYKVVLQMTTEGNIERSICIKHLKKAYIDNRLIAVKKDTHVFE